MMRLWMLATLLSMSCVQANLAQDLRKTTAAMAACGPQETTFDVDALHTAAIPTKEPDKALVYVIEQESSTPALCFGRCGGLTLKVGLDGAWAGALNGSSFTVFSVTPGPHHMCLAWQSHVKKLSEKVALHGFDAEAGRTYFFITHDLFTSPEAGSMAEFTVEPANPDEAKMLIEAYPQVKASPKR